MVDFAPVTNHAILCDDASDNCISPRDLVVRPMSVVSAFIIIYNNTFINTLDSEIKFRSVVFTLAQYNE